MNVGDCVGSYRIIGKVGEGGMGSVFLAEHTLIGRYAAIKVLHSHLSTKEDQVARFFNEAKATSAIKHPGILEIFDFGYHDGDHAYIVMEYLEGETLEARIQRLGRINTEHALHITRQVAGALAAAHARGIVHRDLKPENIYIVRDPEVAGGERIKILDFGIAKMTRDTSSTRTGALIGTPDYMAPEQCRGAGYVDHRADYYALGCILYRMLCGTPPFVGDGVGEVLAAHLHYDPPAPRSIEPSIDPILEEFVLRMLTKDPDNRFQSAQELITELDAVWVGTRPSAFPSGTNAELDRALGKGLASAGPSTISSASMELPAQSEPQGGGSRRLIAITTIAVLIAGGVGYALISGGGSSVANHKQPEAKVAAAAPAPAAEEPAKPDVTAEVDRAKAEPTPAPNPVAPVEQVTIRIETVPSGAEVFRRSDGVRVGKTPYSYSLDPVEGELIYILRRKGYDAKEIVLPANTSADEKVRLTRTHRPKADHKPVKPAHKPAKPGHKPAKPDHKKPAHKKPNDDAPIDPFAD